jgi:hypothetical protein
VLEAIRGALDLPAAQLLDDQIAATAFVSRYINDSYVDLYQQPRREPRRAPVAPFPNKSLDLRLATVAIRGPQGKGKVAASAVDGQLFELHFAPNPKKLGKPHSIEIAGVKLHADPMQESPATAAHLDVVRLDIALRAELEAVWRDRPDWASSVADPTEVYLVHIGDTECLVLAQLPDTTYIAGRVDPPGPGVVRFEPDGDLIIEYASLREAVDSRDIRRR